MVQVNLGTVEEERWQRLDEAEVGKWIQDVQEGTRAGAPKEELPTLKVLLLPASKLKGVDSTTI